MTHFVSDFEIIDGVITANNRYLPDHKGNYFLYERRKMRFLHPGYGIDKYVNLEDISKYDWLKYDHSTKEIQFIEKPNVI